MHTSNFILGNNLKAVFTQKWIYAIYGIFFFSSVTGEYDATNGKSLVFFSIDISDSLLPARYDWEGFLVLFDDQFQYFWAMAIISLVWGICKVTMNSFLISNRLWLKFTPATEKDIQLSRIKTIVLGALIIFGLSSIWAGIYGIRNGIFLPVLLMPGVGLMAHVLFSSSLVILLAPRYAPDKDMPNPILLLIVFAPIILGFLLGQINEGANGWVPYAIMGQAEVRDYPFYRPFISLLVLSIFLLSMGFLQTKNQQCPVKKLKK